MKIYGDMGIDLGIGTEFYYNGVRLRVVPSGRKTCKHCYIQKMNKSGEVRFHGTDEICGVVNEGNNSPFVCDKSDRKDGTNIMFEKVGDEGK